MTSRSIEFYDAGERQKDTPMHSTISRREFLKTAAVAASVALVPRSRSGAAQFRTHIRKAKIVGEVKEGALRPLKEAHFDGVETTHICPEEEAGKGRSVAEKLGMRVLSVLRGARPPAGRSPC